MPTLNWIGKDEIVQHDKEVKFKLFKKLKSCSVGDKSENLLIHGDNLEALKALMPYYQGQIKCIYIDPPYNTGNENWVYNDNVNSPKIKKWLKSKVNRDDLTRHDKWLCMMYPRLKLLKELLSDDGVIFISIDDNEQVHLKMMMDEIFGEGNYIGEFIWQKKEGGGQTDTYFVREHEFVLVYQKSDNFIWINQKEKINIKKFNKEDKKGKYLLVKLEKWGSGARKEDRPSMHFSIKNPKGKDYFPIAPDGNPGRWRVGKQTMDRLIKENKIEWKKSNGQDKPYEKVYYSETQERTIKARSILYNFVNTGTASNTLTTLFGSKDKFENPKPYQLISHLIIHSTSPNDIILDSFAGSGTTGHAVMDLNKEDSGNRRFILIEMEDKVCKPITSERLKRAIKKYNYKEGFEFCELGKPLFDEEGNIEKECDFKQLATYIYFTETQTNIDKKEIKGNFIGEFKPKKSEYYLIFKGKYTNILKRRFIEKIKKNNNKKVIYADQCLIDKDTLEKNNIQFKQIPYEVKKY